MEEMDILEIMVEQVVEEAQVMLVVLVLVAQLLLKLVALVVLELQTLFLVHQ